MYASRVLAGIIAGAIGLAVGGAATGAAAYLVGDRRWVDLLVAFVVHGSPPVPAPVIVGGIVSLAVMVPVFKALERTGLVADPPTRRNTLGLTDRQAAPWKPDPPLHPHDPGRK